MSVIEMQKELGAPGDGWWGEGTHDAYLCQPKRLGLNWAYLRRKLALSFTQRQVDGFNRYLAAGNALLIRPQHLAYILATGWHETDQKMAPIAEYGKGATRRYGHWVTNSRGVKYGIRNSHTSRPVYLASEYPHLYYGRGDVQLTWLDNYIRATKELGVDFANNPDLALDPTNSANILVYGSMRGWFTGKSIPDYIVYGSFAEMVNARRVINGTDRAHLIAGYAKIFLTALELVE